MKINFAENRKGPKKQGAFSAAVLCVCVASSLTDMAIDLSGERCFLSFSKILPAAH